MVGELAGLVVGLVVGELVGLVVGEGFPVGSGPPPPLLPVPQAASKAVKATIDAPTRGAFRKEFNSEFLTGRECSAGMLAAMEITVP